MQKKEFGVVGLGKMGGGLACLAVEKGYKVIGYDPAPNAALREAGIEFIEEMMQFVQQLSAPRRIFLWVPAGALVDALADQLAALLEPGDIIIDGGNSYWGDSKRRATKYKELGFPFLDLGTSGGIEGARNAPCFMIGGECEAVAQVEPLLLDLATPGGYVHAGGPGAGHYVKLVHNGIEFGMLQAIGEGIDLLERFPDELEIANTLECWRHGSVVRSWLIDLMTRAYKEDPEMKRATTYIEDTGEVNWLITDAMTFDVPVPVIAQAVMMLLKSRDAERIADKAIIEMRHEFGGHPYGPLEGVRQERETGRVGAPYRFDVPKRLKEERRKPERAMAKKEEVL